jgi:hypothetical protein
MDVIVPVMKKRIQRQWTSGKDVGTGLQRFYPETLHDG